MGAGDIYTRNNLTNVDMKKPITDTDRINKLQELTKGYGKGWILRESIKGRGMRLHETYRTEASKTVREAIDNYIK